MIIVMMMTTDCENFDYGNDYNDDNCANREENSDDDDLEAVLSMH